MARVWAFLTLLLCLQVGCQSPRLDVREIELGPAQGHSGAILSVAFVSNFAGSFFATGGADGYVRLWDVEARPFAEFPLQLDWAYPLGCEPQGPITDMAGGAFLSYWSREGQEGGSAGACGLSCAHSGGHSFLGNRYRPALCPDGFEIRALAGSRDWTTLLSSKGEATYVSWILSDPITPVATSVSAEDQVFIAPSLVAKVSPRGHSTLIFLRTRRDEDRRWLQHTVSRERPLESGRTPVGVASQSGRGYVITREGELLCYDLSALRLMWSRSATGASVIAAGGSRLALGYPNGSVRLLTAQGEPLAEFPGSERVRALAFSHDESLLAVCGTRGVPRVLALSKTDVE